MIDKKYIGLELPSHSVEVEKGRLRFFSKAIGETNPVYFDEGEARAAGYRSLPVPPTFLFCLEMEVPRPFVLLERLGIDLGRILHGEQSFTYHAPACAGDVLKFQVRVADIYDKKNGALEFASRETSVTNQFGQRVADLKAVIVVRN